MIKTKLINIHEFASAISISVDEGSYWHTRYAHSLKDFNGILKNLFEEARSLGLEPKISRSGVGQFGGITYKDLHLLKQASLTSNN